MKLNIALLVLKYLSRPTDPTTFHFLLKQRYRFDSSPKIVSFNEKSVDLIVRFSETKITKNYMSCCSLNNALGKFDVKIKQLYSLSKIHYNIQLPIKRA